MIDVFFPFWPPSVNHGWGYSGKRTYLTAAGKRFRARIIKYALGLRSEGKLPLEPLSGDLDVQIFLCPPDRKPRDLDNFFKAPLDAMTHSCVWGDDVQIKRLADEWADRVKGGGFRIVIKPFVPTKA